MGHGHIFKLYTFIHTGSVETCVCECEREREVLNL